MEIERIELAFDHCEAMQFLQWLRKKYPNARVYLGRQSATYYNSLKTDPRISIELAQAARADWNAYCNS